MSAKIKIYGAMLREREFTCASLANAAHVNVRTARTVIQRVPPSWLLESTPLRNAKGAPSNVYVVSNVGYEGIRQYLLDHVPQDPSFMPGSEVAEYQEEPDLQLGVSAAKAFLAKVPTLIGSNHLPAAESLLDQAESQIRQIKELGLVDVDHTRQLLELEFALVTLRMQSLSAREPSTKFNEAERILSYILGTPSLTEARRIFPSTIGHFHSESASDFRYGAAEAYLLTQNPWPVHQLVHRNSENVSESALPDIFNSIGSASMQLLGLSSFPRRAVESRMSVVCNHFHADLERYDINYPYFEASREPLLRLTGALKSSEGKLLLQEQYEFSRPLKCALQRIEHDSMVHPRRSLKVLVVSVDGAQTDIRATNISTLLETSLLNYVDVTSVHSASLAKHSRDIWDSTFNCVVICMDAATNHHLSKSIFEWTQHRMHGIRAPKVVVDESETQLGKMAAQRFNAGYIVGSETAGTAKALLEFLEHSEPRAQDDAYYSDRTP